MRYGFEQVLVQGKVVGVQRQYALSDAPPTETP
jgi:hypothetical protein